MTGEGGAILTTIFAPCAAPLTTGSAGCGPRTPPYEEGERVRALSAAPSGPPELPSMIYTMALGKQPVKMVPDSSVHSHFLPWRKVHKSWPMTGTRTQNWTEVTCTACQKHREAADLAAAGKKKS
jgi:hypothetical protein